MASRAGYFDYRLLSRRFAVPEETTQLLLPLSWDFFKQEYNRLIKKMFTIAILYSAEIFLLLECIANNHSNCHHIFNQSFKKKKFQKIFRTNKVEYYLYKLRNSPFFLQSASNWVFFNPNTHFSNLSHITGLHWPSYAHFYQFKKSQVVFEYENRAQSALGGRTGPG